MRKRNGSSSRGFRIGLNRDTLVAAFILVTMLGLVGLISFRGVDGIRSPLVRHLIGYSREQVERCLGEPANCLVNGENRVLLFERKIRGQSKQYGNWEKIDITWIVLDSSDVVVDAGVGKLPRKWAPAVRTKDGVLGAGK